MKLNPNKALIIFSGGQDSTTCLYWAKQKFAELKILSFDYGQKHSIEIESAKKIAEMAGLELDLVSIPEVLRSSSPLTDHNEELAKYESVEELPGGLEATFVPGRNILFLTLAANIAANYGAANIVMGVCEEDFGGYYDCRQDFIDAMQVALNQGICGADQGFTIHTPLMSLSKKETVELARDLGEDCLEALSYSHTCYEGSFPPCGHCHACLLRARGFNEAGLEDPLLKRARVMC